MQHAQLLSISTDLWPLESSALSVVRNHKNRTISLWAGLHNLAVTMHGVWLTAINGREPWSSLLCSINRIVRKSRYKVMRLESFAPHRKCHYSFTIHSDYDHEYHDSFDWIIIMRKILDDPAYLLIYLRTDVFSNWRDRNCLSVWDSCT
jgi:hypothetical protein